MKKRTLEARKKALETSRDMISDREEMMEGEGVSELKTLLQARINELEDLIEHEEEMQPKVKPPADPKDLGIGNKNG